MRRDLFFGPPVILLGANDELDFIGAFQMRQVLPTIAVLFAAARAFQVHDAAHARVHRRDVERAAGFEEHGETVVAKRFHEREGVGLEQRFASGQFHQRQRVAADVSRLWWSAEWGVRSAESKRRRQAMDFTADFVERNLFTLSERVSRIAIRAAEIAGGEAHEYAWQPGESAFTLDAHINFVDDQRVRHRNFDFRILIFDYPLCQAIYGRRP